MISNLNKSLIAGLICFNSLNAEVRQPDETLQLQCNSKTNVTILWLQIDLERNEHLAWDPKNPMESIILKKMKIKPTLITFEFQGKDLVLDRNRGTLNWDRNSYLCQKISMEESEISRINKLKEIKNKRLF